MLTLNGLCSAHGVIVPMQCEYFALEGLTDLVNTIKQVHANMNHDLQIIGLLRVMFDPRITLQQQVSDQLKSPFRRQGVQHRDSAQCPPGRGAQLWPARRDIRSGRRAAAWPTSNSRPKWWSASRRCSQCAAASRVPATTPILSP